MNTWSIYHSLSFAKRCDSLDLPPVFETDPDAWVENPPCISRRENHGKAKARTKDDRKAQGDKERP
jgi:hypothetical protein